MVGQAKEDLKLIQTKNKLQLNNLWLRQIVTDIFVAKWLQLIETGRNSNTKYVYRGSPISTVSTSTNSTSTIFSAIGIKLVLVEFLELPM